MITPSGPTGLVFQANLTNDNSGWAGFTARNVLDMPSGAVFAPPGYQSLVRVRHSAGTGGWDIAEAYIGNSTGTGPVPPFYYIADTVPTRLTFNGGSSSASLGDHESIWSDWVSFVMDKQGHGLVITNYTNIGAAHDTQASYDASQNFSVGNTFTNANEAGLSQPPGSYTSSSNFWGISAIEMDGFGTPSRLRRLQSWQYGPTSYI